MSEHLKVARNFLNLVHQMTGWDSLRSLNVKVDRLTSAVWEQQAHLEAQQETLVSASHPTEQPAPSSSEAIETEPEMSDTYRTFWSKSYPANLGLIDWRPAVRDISVWLSSLPILGNELGVEIGVTLTSKASTPQSGSASPSTGEPTREDSGVAGRYDMRPFLEADGYPDSPASSPEPAQGGRKWSPEEIDYAQRGGDHP